MKNNQNISILKIPLLFLWPFTAFLLSLREINKTSSAIVFILFCALYGYAFTFLNTSADSSRIAFTFANFDFYSLNDIYIQYLRGGTPDIYRYLAYGITKIYTDNPKFLYATFGLIFGIFWYLSILTFQKEKGDLLGPQIFILFVIFLIINPITNVNGARFNTAIWVFFYSSVNLILYNKKAWIFGIICSPLIHFSFLFAAPTVLGFYFFHRAFHSQKRIYIWTYIIFIFSFLVSWVLETNIIKINTISDSINLSQSIDKKLNSYNSDELAALYDKRRSGSLFLQISKYAGIIIKINFFLLMALAKNHIKSSPISEQKKLNKLYAFTILFMSFGYIASSLPSGGRFLTISYLFAIIFLINIVRYHNNRLLQKLIYFLLVSYSFHIVFQIYLNLSLVSYDLWFNNIFMIIYNGLGYTPTL